MRFPVVRWFFSLPAAIFYGLAVLAMHDRLGAPNGVLAFLALLAQFLLPGSIALWILSDARRRGRALPYDAGTFYFFAWPVLAPIYLFCTRGWRAFAPLGWFLLLYVAAALVGSIPHLVFVLRQ